MGAENRTAGYGSGHGGGGQVALSPHPISSLLASDKEQERRPAARMGQPLRGSGEELLTELDQFIEAGGYRQSGFYPSRADFQGAGKLGLWFRLLRRVGNHPDLAARYGLKQRRGGAREYRSQRAIQAGIEQSAGV